MIGEILSFLWWLLMLPIRLIKLPFKIVSTIVSLVIWAVVLLVIGAAVALWMGWV